MMLFKLRESPQAAEYSNDYSDILTIMEYSEYQVTETCIIEHLKSVKNVLMMHVHRYHWYPSLDQVQIIKVIAYRYTEVV